MFKMTIKAKILTVILTVVAIVSFALLFSQYYFSEKLTLQSTSETFTNISKNIREHIRQETDSTKNIVKVKSQHSDILEEITFDPKHPALPGFVQVLEIKKNLHAIYFAHENGNFYELVNMRNRPLLYKTFNAPKQTFWTVITIIDNIEQRAYLDKDLNLIDKERLKKQYDPRLRIWYTKAQKSKEVISTAPYFFSHSRQMGKTYAKALSQKGTVLAIDYTMDQISSILSMQKSDTILEVFIVHKKGNKLLSSDYTQDTKPVLLDEKHREYVLNNRIGEILKYKKKGRAYYAIFSPLSTKDTYLGIEANADKLMKIHKDNLLYSFGLSFILLLLAIPLILFASESIAKPVKDLIVENHKIQKRKFTEVKKIDTSIVELSELSDSLVSMSGSIQKHEKSQDELLDSIIKLIAEAIDKKSPYTGKHCARVPLIALQLLDAANKSQSDVFKAFSLSSKEELREFEIGAWLHDCGKVTTPAFVVDKSVKLETIYNRIHEIRMRFEVLWRDAQISYLKKETDEAGLKQRQKQLLDDFDYVASANVGSEFMNKEKKIRLKEIAKIQWVRHFDNKIGLGAEESARYKHEENQKLPVTEDLLNDKVSHIVPRVDFDHSSYEKEGFKLEVPEYLYNYGEIYNLCIEKGTLTPEERYKINEHVIMSIKMLEKIPFPDNMNNVVEYAGTHHETLIGTGYPRQLSRSELSIPARIMAIADIFEALTASDRPYKKSKTISEAIKIMSFMVKDQHIDKDLFELFLRSGVYKEYAQTHLNTEQIDEVDIEEYLL